MLSAGKLISKLLLLGIMSLTFGGGMLPLGKCSASGQETLDAAVEESPQVQDSRIQPQPRMGPNRLDRPLSQYSAEEIRELERVYSEAKQLPTTLDSANIRVRVQDETASIQSEFTASNSAPGIVNRIDLGMKSCQLVAVPEFSIPDTSITTAQEIEQRVIPTLDGYQWLMLSPSPTRHRLVLNAQSLVDRSSGRQSITIDLPVVQSEILVQLPAGTTDERVRSEDLMISRTTDESSVILEIRSRGGQFTISWSQTNVGRPTGVIEATSETIYEPFDLMNPSQSWSATTTLSIRWASAAGSQKVYIRLPPGGQWSNLPYSEMDLFSLSFVPFEEFDSTPDIQHSLSPEIPSWDAPTLDTGTGALDSVQAEVLVIENQDPLAIRSVDDLVLGWRWMPESENFEGRPNTFIVRAPKISGIDTLDGTLGVIFPSSYDYIYYEHAGTFLIERGPAHDSSTSRDQVLFGFNDLPAGVNISFQKERILPTLRPTHRVQVAEGKLELTTWLHCWFDGNPTEIVWYPSGWELDQASAVLLRDSNVLQNGNAEPLQVQRKEDGNYVLSSRPSESTASTQRAEQIWRLVAYRDWNAKENSRIEFQLPLFDRGVAFGHSRMEAGSGSLIVVGEDYVVLQQDESLGRGIWPDFAQSDSSPYVRPNSRSALFFRFMDQGDETPEGISWHGNAVLLPQQIRQEQRVELEVQESGIGISQSFDLQIANRPLTRLNLLVREDALPIQVTVGETILPYEELSRSETAGNQDFPSWREIQIALFSSLQGRVRVAVQCSISWQPGQDTTDSTIVNSGSSVTDSAGASTSLQPALIEVPLVGLQWTETEVQDNGRWQLQPNSEYQVRFAHPNRLPAEYQPVSNSEMELAEDQKSIRLSIQRRSHSQQQPIISNGIWLQTVLAGSDRRDRFVARIRSSTRQITVQLPEQAVVEKVALGGMALSQDLAPYDYNSNQITVLLPDQNEHVLEVIYLLGQPLAWAQKLTMTSATIVGAKHTDRFYWQLVSPGVYHLGWCPAELTAEWRWKWSTAWWNRVSDLDQASLESWMGAANLTRVPVGTNSYVMSAREQPHSMDVWIFSRIALWLPTGLTAILIAWLISNIRALRSANSAILVVAGVITLAMIWPEFSVLLTQTMLAAMTLVALIWLTQAAIGSRVKRRSIFSSRSQTLQEASGSAPSISTRSRPTSNSNSAARAAVAETTGTE